MLLVKTRASVVPLCGGFTRNARHAFSVTWYLRIGSSDVFVKALVMVDGIFQVLQLRGQVHLAARLAPRVHITHVLQGENRHMLSHTS